MSTNRSGGRLRFLDQSDAEAALLRARLEAVTRLAALTNRTRLDVEREAAALGLDEDSLSDDKLLLPLVSMVRNRRPKTMA